MDNTFIKTVLAVVLPGITIILVLVVILINIILLIRFVRSSTSKKTPTEEVDMEVCN